VNNMSQKARKPSKEAQKGFLLSTPSSIGEEKKIDAEEPNDREPSMSTEKANGHVTNDEVKKPARSFSVVIRPGLDVEVRTLKDFLTATPKERQWTVEGLLPDCGLAVLGGRQKRGKSTLAIHLNRSVSSGEDFLERPTKKKPVIYVNYEMPADYFAELSKAGPIPEDFYLIERPEPKLQMKTIMAVMEAMKELGYSTGLVVLDSFRGAFKLKAEQENQSGEAGSILRELQEIGLKTGWIIFVIHHHKKNADREGADNLSGTSDFGAAPDVIWTWTRPADASQPGELSLEGRIPPIEPQKVMLTPTECTWLGRAQEASAEAQEQRILETLGTKRLTGNELQDITGIPYSTIMKRLDSLSKKAKVDNQVRKGSGSPKESFRTIVETVHPMPDIFEETETGT
jgi:hypothetical protein